MTEQPYSNPFDEAWTMFKPRVERWEAADVAVEQIFHAFAQAFGMALSRYCETDVAVAFLEQEIGRMKNQAISPKGTETRQ